MLKIDEELQSMAQSLGIGRNPPRSAASSTCAESWSFRRKMGRRSTVVLSRYWGRIIECPKRKAATENSTGMSLRPL